MTRTNFNVQKYTKTKYNRNAIILLFILSNRNLNLKIFQEIIDVDMRTTKFLYDMMFSTKKTNYRKKAKSFLNSFNDYFLEKFVSYFQTFLKKFRRDSCYVPALSTGTPHLATSPALSIRQACLTALVTLQSIEFLDSLIMLRLSTSELKNEQEISDESSTERFTKRFISWYSHHDLKTTWRRQVDESKSTSKLSIS
jgi:hypothetical protein